MNCIAEKKKLLMIITSMCAGLSTILLIMSVTSEHWLHTKERYKGDIKKLGIYPYNQTEVYISTNFGLWRACSKYIDKFDKVISDGTECFNLKYLRSDEAVDEDGEETILNGILKSCKKTTIFPMLSIFLELSGDVTCLMAYCFGKKRYLIFLTGCLFVASGMSLLVGSILFMGAVTGEANHQPHVPDGEIPAFRYIYASSFIMLTLAFCLDEISGVLSVYLFIIRHKESVKKRHAKLTAHKSKSDHIQNYFRRKSRNYSMSSNGDVSRRSSHMPDTPHDFSGYNINRDTSHITMLTTIESHNNLQSAAVPLMSSQDTADDNENQKLQSNNIKPNHSRYESMSDTGSTILPLTTILPPDEFMSTPPPPQPPNYNPEENHKGLTNNLPPPPSYNSYVQPKVIKCKTTSV